MEEDLIHQVDGIERCVETLRSERYDQCCKG